MKPSPPPASVLDVKITFQCNNLCRFCVAGDNRMVFTDVPAARARKILSSNKGLFESVRFTGGEPTIRPDLPDLIAYASKLGYKQIIIQTNGRRLAYTDYTRELVDAGATQFAVSIHGHSSELHDWLTQRKGSFTETVLGIKNAAGAGADVATNTVVTKSGYAHLPDIAGLLCALGVRQMQFAFPHLQGKALENAVSVVPKHTLTAAPLRAAVETAKAAGRTALTEGFPFCFLTGIEDHSLEMRGETTKIVDPHGGLEIGDYHEHRKKTLRRLGPSCPRCAWFKTCEGPWEQYPSLFSWREFLPVKKKGVLHTA